MEVMKNVPMPEKNKASASGVYAPRKKSRLTRGNAGAVKSSARVVMGYKIENGRPLKERATRPFSLEPLFTALKVGESFEVKHDKVTAFKSAVYRYTRRLKPRVFIFVPRGKNARVGRVK